ncbi:hypothetical protein D4739_00375 [Nocardioides cavernaquae]|uniref:Glycosyltransferase RgtA/B/C/D-like domain-containing protein n=1 Tax=Nocardioides cavernaquae TaxID=2321396 RepID=A0A3A5H4N6_9ACTN|nr:hypothetical protein D4739_00375 [Nocardioides cavernaquae]
MRRGAPAAALIALIALAIRIAIHGLTNDDTFFHLRIGDEFLRGRWDLDEPGSLTSYGTRDWVPTQWLSEVVMAGAEDLAGTGGIVWLFGTIFVAYALTLYAVARISAPPIVAILVAGAAFVGSGGGLSARPQVMSYLFAALVTAAWLGTMRDGRVRWWIIPLTWLWAMLHGMWPVAIVISAVGAVGVVADRRPERGQALRILSLPLLALVAAFLTPLGPRLVVEILTVTSRGKYFFEWGPTDFHAFQPAVLVLLLAISLIAMLRAGPARWTHLLLLLLAGAWALYALRTIPLAAAIAAPCAALALGELAPKGPRIDRRGALTLVALGAAASAVLAFLSSGAHTVGPDRPDWADAELDKLPAATGVLNAWDWGGYLAWRHPDLDFVVSGYGDVFTTGELDRNVALTEAHHGWLDDLEGLHVEVALLAPDSDLAYGLEHTAGWTVVRSSDEMVLLHAPE